MTGVITNQLQHIKFKTGVFFLLSILLTLLVKIIIIYLSNWILFDEFSEEMESVSVIGFIVIGCIPYTEKNSKHQSDDVVRNNRTKQPKPPK